MAKRSRARSETVPEAAEQTLRQQLRALLEAEEWDFDQLRSQLRMKPPALESELEHLARSLKTQGLELKIRSAVCTACSYEFTPKKGRPFHAPRRCPKCKAERVSPPSFRIRES